MLFVVTGSTFVCHCLSSMFDFDAICSVPEHLAIHCVLSMRDFDGICRDQMHF